VFIRVLLIVPTHSCLQGQIMTQSGNVMPSGDRPEWRNLFAHVCRTCSLQQPPLEHVALRLNVADMDALAERLAGVAPHRARSEIPLFVTASTRGSSLTNPASLRGVLASLNISLHQLSFETQSGLPVNFEGLVAMLTGGLKQHTTLSQRSAAVIIVDLDNNEDVDFGWIPVPLPSSVRIIIAAQPSVRIEQALHALSFHAGFPLHRVAAPALSVDDSVGILSNLWHPISGMPYPEGDRVRNLITANHTGSALYLRLLCGFARAFKVPFEELANRAPNSLTALINHVLAAMESETPVAGKALASVLALSRHTYPFESLISAARHLAPSASEADLRNALNGPLAVFLYPRLSPVSQAFVLHHTLNTALASQ
jgi:hypothetical protein